MSAHRYIELGVELTALLFKAPRTVPQLHELTGFKDDTIWRYVNALHDEGLIFRSGFSESGAHQFSWQPSVGEMRDVVRCTPRHIWRKQERMLRWIKGHPVIAGMP